MITPVPTPESIIETEEESESEWENDKEDKADKEGIGQAGTAGFSRF